MKKSNGQVLEAIAMWILLGNEDELIGVSDTEIIDGIEVKDIEVTAPLHAYKYCYETNAVEIMEELENGK